MRSVFPAVAVVLLSHLACSKAAGRPSTDAGLASSGGKEPTIPGFKPRTGDKTEAKTLAPPPSGGKVPVDGGLPQIEPLKEGKRVRITKLRETRPLEITVPTDMRLTMEDPEDLPPKAILKGRDGVIEIFNPESPWDGLDGYLNTKSLDHAESIHTQKLLRGFLVISRIKSKWSPEGYRYIAIVSRPDLGVDCGLHYSHDAMVVAQIKRIASICLSLREVGSGD